MSTKSAIFGWLRLVGLLCIGIAVIGLVVTYVQRGLDRKQEKMDEAVRYLQRGQ